MLLGQILTWLAPWLYSVLCSNGTLQRELSRTPYLKQIHHCPPHSLPLCSMNLTCLPELQAGQGSHLPWFYTHAWMSTTGKFWEPLCLMTVKRCFQVLFLKCKWIILRTDSTFYCSKNRLKVIEVTRKAHIYVPDLAARSQCQYLNTYATFYKVAKRFYTNYLPLSSPKPSGAKQTIPSFYK